MGVFHTFRKAKARLDIVNRSGNGDETSTIDLLDRLADRLSQSMLATSICGCGASRRQIRRQTYEIID